MSKSNAFETALLNHIFANQDIAGLGDAGGLLASVADGNLYIALHTADPGEAGNASTNETGYTGYARKAVSRTDGFSVSGDTVNYAADQDFPSGASMILYSGSLSQVIGMQIGTIPRIKASSSITED